MSEDKLFNYVSISSNAAWSTWYKDEAVVSEDSVMSIILKDGTEKRITFKEYMMFVAYWRKLPSDCKDSHELEKRLLAMRL